MNLTPTVQKMLIGAVLFGAWSYLVFTGKVASTDYVENIKILLGGLGLYHVTQAATKPKSDDKASASPTTVVNE